MQYRFAINFGTLGRLNIPSDMCFIFLQIWVIFHRNPGNLFPFLGLRDIDVEEEDNPALCYEYAPLIYKYLRQVEREQVIRKDFLKVRFLKPSFKQQSC